MDLVSAIFFSVPVDCADAGSAIRAPASAAAARRMSMGGLPVRVGRDRRRAGGAPQAAANLACSRQSQPLRRKYQNGAITLAAISASANG